MSRLNACREDVPSAPNSDLYVVLKLSCHEDKSGNIELPLFQSTQVTQVTMERAKQKAILMARIKMSSGTKPAGKNQVKGKDDECACILIASR